MDSGRFAVLVVAIVAVWICALLVANAVDHLTKAVASLRAYLITEIDRGDRELHRRIDRETERLRRELTVPDPKTPIKKHQTTHYRPRRTV